jgi:hypothetical protein
MPILHVIEVDEGRIAIAILVVPERPPQRGTQGSEGCAIPLPWRAWSAGRSRRALHGLARADLLGATMTTRASMAKSVLLWRCRQSSSRSLLSGTAWAVLASSLKVGGMTVTMMSLLAGAITLPMALAHGSLLRCG